MLLEMIAACGRNFATKTAYVQGGRSISWGGLDRRSSALAASLRAMGAGPGRVAAILSQERLEVYEHWFACIKAGAIRVGINWRYAPAQMKHILSDCRPSVLFVDAQCVASLAPLRETLDAIGCRVVGFGPNHGQALDYESVLAAGAGGSNERVTYCGEEPVLYTYTSGTTGSPKGVIISERAVATAIVQCALQVGLRPDDLWYRPNQSSWVVLVGNCANLANGATMVIPDGVFDVKGFLSDVERLKISLALLVPTSLRRVLDEVCAGRHDLSSLRCLVYGGGAIAPQLVRETFDTLGCTLVQTYGLTEATWATYLQHADHVRALRERPELLSSAGRFAPHFDASIRDDEGRPLPAGEIGTLWLKGPCVMNGYLNQPQLTREALKDGWLVTHDMGCIDEEGYLFLKDRKNFLIVTGGVNVYGSAVEAALAEHPAVHEVAVVGIPDPEWGEAVAAAVVLRVGATLRADELLRSCSGRLARMEMPKRVAFVGELPKTFTGKVDKLEIRRMLSAEPAVPSRADLLA